MDDYEYSDTPCPKCGHSPTHWRRCTAIGCDDGWIDMHEYDDPLWYDPGEEEMCDECYGTGIEHWCPKCGYNLSAYPQLSDNRADENTSSNAAGEGR